jgi:hypothetical protein
LLLFPLVIIGSYQSYKWKSCVLLMQKLKINTAISAFKPFRNILEIKTGHLIYNAKLISYSIILVSVNYN